MNSVLVIFGVFTLGLQNFNGNNGIAPVSAATEFDYLKGVVNMMINSKLGTRNEDYTNDVQNVEGLKGKIEEYFKDGIYKGLKNETIHNLNKFVENTQVKEENARPLRDAINALKVNETNTDFTPSLKYMSGTPPSE